MNKKIQRELHGPGWGEVVLGALLSLVLGVVFGAAFLVLKPVQKVKELPKEPVASTVYFIEGSTAAARARLGAGKAKSFMQGQSVVFNEDELNGAVNSLRTTPPKAGVPSLPTPASDKAIEPGNPNFRIRDSVLQIGLPVKLTVYGLSHEVVIQARGGFTKQGDVFVFDPSQVYVGSCPIERMPAVRDYVFKELLAAAALPADVPAAWQKLTDVTVDGANLKLTTAVQ